MNPTELSVAYSSLTPLRAAVQCIPAFGGAIDTLLSSLGTTWQSKCIKTFISTVENELNSLKNKNLLTEDKFIECLAKQEAIAIITNCIRESLQAIDDEKIKLFSCITKNYLSGREFTQNSEIEKYIRTTRNITLNEFEYLHSISCGIHFVHIISNYGTYLQPDKIYAKPMTICFSYGEDIEDDWKIKQDEIDALNALINEKLIKDNHCGQENMIITGNGGFISDFPHADKIKYELTEYGKKYLAWVT